MVTAGNPFICKFVVIRSGPHSPGRSRIYLRASADRYSTSSETKGTTKIVRLFDLLQMPCSIFSVTRSPSLAMTSPVFGSVSVSAQLASDQARIIGRKGFDHPAVWGFDETIFIDPGKGCQAADQTNVRAFRGFDRANAAVMGMVHIAHIKTGALTAQTARTKAESVRLWRSSASGLV